MSQNPISENAPAFIKKYFPALTYRNYRLFFSGNCISLIGTWMQILAQSWLVQEMTQSVSLASYVAAAQSVPILVLSFFSGVIIERFPKRNLLIITQSLSAILALSLSLAVLSGVINYTIILIIAFLLGCVNSFDNPTRLAFASEATSEKHIPNAVALNSSIFNIARIFGPAFAGIMMEYTGPFWCFFINALSFIPVIFVMMRIPRGKPSNKTNENILVQAKDGILYIMKRPILLYTQLTVFFVASLAINFNVLLPALTQNTFKMGANSCGTLFSVMGFGSLTGALFALYRSNKKPGGIATLMFGSLAIGACNIIIGLISSYLFLLPVMFIVGFFNVTTFTTANQTLQLRTDETKRGRVLSLYTLASVGSAPIGNLLSGKIASMTNPSFSFVVCGSICLGLCLLNTSIFGAKAYRELKMG